MLTNVKGSGQVSAPIRALQRDIPVLFRRVLVALGREHRQGLDQLFAGFVGLDDGVDEAAFGGNIGVGKTLAKLRDFFGPHLGERGVIVRLSPPLAVPPALALARKAWGRAPAANPHAIRADYGSVDYYSKPSASSV